MKEIKDHEQMRQWILDRSCPEALTGCWLWLASKTMGYGDIRVKLFKTRKAHRISYIVFRGPVPDDLVIDHKCMNRSCVNPDHLEPVTLGENSRRYAASVVRCWRGHEFTSRDEKQRICRECNRIRMAEWRAKKRGA